MPPEVFSAEWAAEWCRQLNQSATYRAAAAGWEGSIALVMVPKGSSGERRAVFADLWHGECRAARPATEQDLESARFVFTANDAHWRDVLAGKTAPLLAVMTGKIKLTRGSLGALAPFAGAAKELLATAQAIGGTFTKPDGN